MLNIFLEKLPPDERRWALTMLEMEPDLAQGMLAGLLRKKMAIERGDSAEIEKIVREETKQTNAFIKMLSLKAAKAKV